MHNKLFVFFSVASLLVLMTGEHFSRALGKEQEGEDVRKPILAGTWYPGTRSALTDLVEAYLSGAKVKPPEGELKAVIVPHAGYVYSGQVAAHAYRLVQRSDFRTVIMIGPSHRAAFRGVSVNLQAGYETPLGTVPVDLALARKIINTSPSINYVPQAHALEHSLEIQLPFLQTVLEDFQIVPILMGEQDYRSSSHLAGSLVQVLNTMDRILILASTDLSHFYRYERARELDMEFIKHVRQFDPQGLAKSLSAGSCEACGQGLAVVTMLVARSLGANQAVILKYANSGDVTGDHSRVVGYLSAALLEHP